MTAYFKDNPILGPRGPAGPGGIATSDQYEAQEKIVGSWIDGSPVYQRTFQGATAGVINSFAELGNIPNFKLLISASGVIYYNADNVYYGISDEGRIVGVRESGIVVVYNTNGATVNCPVHVIVQYLKEE